MKKQMFGAIPIEVVSKLTSEKVKGEVVFIHMSWGGAWAFEKYMNYFTQYGYNTHALSLRGHGKSGGNVVSATMQDYVNDVRTAVQGLGLKNPVVVGHSMGGLIALDYSAQFGAEACVSIDGSPSLEVQKTSEEKTYPLSYTPGDSGMPGNPLAAMKVLPDMPIMELMKMKFKLTVESGVARSDRKRGVSVPKEKLSMPLLFVGAQLGTSLPFGIGFEKAKAQATYYGAPVIEIKGATHPGMLFGHMWPESAKAIINWLNKK